MTTNLLNNLSNVLKKGPSETQKNPLSCEAQSAAEKSNRVLITRLSRVNSLMLPRTMRYVAMIFAVLTLSIANIGMAWGADFTPAQIASGTTTSGISVSSSFSKSTGNKLCTSQTSEDAIQVNSSAGGAYNDKYIWITVPANCKITNVGVLAKANGTTACTGGVVYWSGVAATDGVTSTETLAAGSNGTSDCTGKTTLTVPANTRTVGIYRAPKIKNNAFNGSGTAVGGTSTFKVFALSVTATGTVTHNLTNVTKSSGNTTATLGSAYNASYAASDGYTLPSTITVTINGSAATSGTDYTWNSSTGAFTVPAAKVNGAIVITITGEAAAAGSGWGIASSDNSWTASADEMSGSGTVTKTLSLSANADLQFKIVDISGNTWYGNGEIWGGTKTQSVSSTGTSNNCHLLTTEAGSYTFSFNTSTKDLTITYPNSYKVYYKNTGSWGSVKAYKYTYINPNTGENAAWASAPTVSTTEEICGDTYYYTMTDGYKTIIFYNGSNDSQKSGDMDAASGSGKYVSGTGNSWTAFPTYTVTYNKNGDGAGGAGSVTGSVPTDSNSPYACGSTVTVLGNTGSLALDGYTFAGWNTAPGGGGTSYAANATFTISANTTLYAQWEENASYSVTYNANGATGSVPTDANTYANGEEVTVLGKNTLAKTNYGFAGWRTAVSSGTWYVQGQTFEMGSANVNLYAQWVAEASMVSGTLYKAVDMKASAASATGQYRAGISANGIFEVLGVGVVDATTGPMEYGSDSRTIDGTAFTEALHFKGTGSGSPSGSTLPTTRAIKFRVPAAGTLHLWVRAGSKIAIVKDGGSASAVGSSTDRTYETAAVTAGTYYLYATGTSVSLYGLQFVQSCTAPTALSAGSTTAKGTTFTVTDGANTNDYEFYVSTSSTAPLAGATATHTSTSKTKAITDCIAGTTYYAWVRSKCSASNKSDWVALGDGGTFTTSTVNADYHLTNVTKSSGATTGIGGSTFTAVFAAVSGYSLPSPVVTIGGNSATSGTDYTWTAGTGTLTINANKINGDIDITMSSPVAAPSSVAISGDWLYFAGETIELTATPTGGNGPVTYQWYKGGKTDGDEIDGATSATYSKASCAYEDAGSYYCKVTCGGSASTWGQSGDAYDVKIPRLYVKTGHNYDPVKPDYGNVDFTRATASTATASISLGSNWDYCFNIADGCGHYFGNAGTMQYNNYGPWTTNVNNQDCGLRTTNGATYIFTIDYSNWTQLKTTVTFPSSDQAADKIIYFDNQTVDWSTLHYRIGRANHTQATPMTKVPGTNNLYTVTTAAYNNAAGWHIANNAGWTGSNSIYRTYTNGDEYSITYATAHEGGAVTDAAVTVTPTTSRGTGADAGINDNCTFYNYEITTGMKTQNVAISDYSNGTITVNYVNTSNEAATLTSGNADLAHSVILTSITAVPNTGYDASAITINGGAYSANYVVTGATTIAASFTPHVYDLTWNLGGGTTTSAGTGIASGVSVNTTSGVAYGASLSAPSVERDGYDFVSWSPSVAGTMPAANTTYTATWAQKYTVKYNYNGATSGATPASVTSSSVTLPSPSRTGYEFDGWYKTDGTKVGAGGATYNPTADVVLYARWQTTCAAGGDETLAEVAAASISSITASVGSVTVYEMNSSADPDDGADIGGGKYAIKFTAGNNEYIRISPKAGKSFTAGDILYITIYNPGSGTKNTGYSITGGTGANTNIAEGGTHEFSYALVAGAINGSGYIEIKRASSNSNYGWFVSARVVREGGGGGTCYSVKYCGNGAESGFVSDTISYSSGDDPVVLDNAGRYPYERDGYRFTGWNTAPEGGGSSYAAGSTITDISGNVTLYAQWSSCTKPGTPGDLEIKEGTLTNNSVTMDWDPDGITSDASGYMVSIVRVSDGYVVRNWTSDGIYDIGGGWYYDVTGLDQLTGYHFIVRAIGASGYCDYGDTARYTFSTLGTPYTITYHLNGASWINEGAAVYYHGTGYTLPIYSDMSNTGYTFGGWYDNSGLTGSAVTEISAEATGDKEFWAKWTENTYTITYDANGGSGSMTGTTGHYVTIKDNGFTAPSGDTFVEWNTTEYGDGASYSPGDEIELTGDMTLYAIWADDYTITWEASAKLSGVAVTPNLGGGNYTITADVGAWNGTLTTSMISAVTDGVTITNVAVDNSASPKTITATFNVGESVAGTSITLELDVPAYGDYAAKSSTKEITIDRCTGSSSGSDGVLFSAEFKDSGLGTSNICAAANTPYTFTTTELKSAPTGGSISAYTTGELSHLRYVDNGVYLKGADGVIKITLDAAISTNDLFEYVNVHSSCPNAYLRHTSPTTTSDQIVLTGYSSRNVKVMLPAAFNGKTELYIVKSSTDFKLHKAAIVRPAFLMLVDDEASTGNLEGTDVELTTSTYLSVMKGGHVYYTSPTSGDVKITQSSSKNYITLAKTAGYLKVVLNDALQEGDIIGFDTSNGSSEICFATTTTRSTDEHTSSQLYTVGSSSPLKEQTTFYIWYYSSSTTIRGLQIARSGIAGGGGGTDQITPTLTWTPALNTDADWDNINNRLNKETGDADFTYTVTQDKNSLGAISYSSSNTSVATVNATSGKVHIVGGGDATITATIAESGCYEEATATYAIHVVDNCDDVAGTIEVEDLGCEDGYRMTVTGHTAAAGVSYQWYKVGSPDTEVGTNQDNYTTKTAGEYYVIVTNTGDGHCSMVSANTITITASVTPTATKIVNSWYIKNGRRTPDIALVQTTNAENFQVKKGEVVIWDTKESVTTGYAGCSFYLATDGIIYLMGQKPDESAPSGLTAGDETLTFIVSSCGGTAETVSITIHKQEATTRPSVAFVVDGTKEGTFAEENEDHSVNTALYQFLDYGSDSQGAFDLTGQNVYSTVDEKAIREHYSQFDAILITDDPSTDTKIGKVSCVNAFGTMIDVRPILTMEAFVSKWSNWKAKGIDGNPSSPNPRQYAMKLDCKNHAIFVGIDPASSNVLVEDIDGVEYWTVTMVDKAQSPYSGVADDTDTDGKPALQGFSASDVSSLMLLGEISNGTLYAGVERQEEAAARLLLLGLNNKALPNALTPEGKKIIENSLTYLLETDMEKVDDCSNYFTDAAGDKQWNNAANWTKGIVPNSPYVKARILKPCVLSGLTAKVARVDIASSGKSLHLSGGECSGSLTIDPTGALISGGAVRSAEAPYFNMGDLMPTEEDDLILNTSSTNQAALIFNNDEGKTQATVNLYSLGRTVSETNQFQYFAIPMSYLSVNPTFANETHGITIYTYVWLEATGWERRGYYTDLYAFEGIGITTDKTTAHEYTMKGTLASTKDQEIPITADGKKLNLIGNSWTAPIQISELEASDFGDASSAVEQTVYIYCTGYGKATSGDETETAGQWLAIPFNATDFAAWEGLKVIPSMQSFQIKTTGAGTLTLDYKKHVRGGTTDLTAKLRAPKRKVETDGVELMRIRVADSQTHTDLYLFEGDQFTDEFDNGWEANYRVGTSESAKLYARVATGVMSVAAMPSLESTPVYFIPGQETEYMFTFGGEGMGYYLNDIKMQRSTLISTEATYSFTYEKGDAAARFYISKTPIDAGDTPTGWEGPSDQVKAQKIIYDNKLYIIVNGALYDATGKKVNSK